MAPGGAPLAKIRDALPGRRQRWSHGPPTWFRARHVTELSDAEPSGKPLTWFQWSWAAARPQKRTFALQQDFLFDHLVGARHQRPVTRRRAERRGTTGVMCARRPVGAP